MDVSTPESSRDSRRLVARPRLARLDLDAREFSRVESPLAPPRARSRPPATAASSSPDAARRARRALPAVLSRASIARARVLRASSIVARSRSTRRRSTRVGAIEAFSTQKIFRDQRISRFARLFIVSRFVARVSYCA